MVWDGHAAVREMDQLYLDEQEQWRNPNTLVRYWDKFMSEVGEEHSYEKLEFSEPRFGPGGLSMSVPKSDFIHYDHFFRNPDGEDATIPLTVNTAGWRWDGYVTKASLVRDGNGLETVEVEGIHCWQHVGTTCFWASPFAPILAQFPRHHFAIGPILTISWIWLITNYTRRQLPLWQPPEDYRDAPEWVDFGNALFPIAVVPVDFAHDTSKWGAGAPRFDMADQYLAPLMKDAGGMIRARFFIPDEDEQPAPSWFVLDEPTVVLELLNKDGTTGVTGTALDGITKWVEDFLDDGVTPVRYPALDATDDYETTYETGPLGTKRNWPWVWYFEGEYSGIGHSEIAVHKPLATHILVGGKSPGWLNASIEFAIKNMLAWLGLAIGVPGLDALYMGQLDDVFLAFAEFKDLSRIQRAGPYAFREHFVTGSDKAFTLDGFMSGRHGLHDTRGYTSKKATVRDNAPYLVGPGKDYWIGDQIGFRLGDVIYTDYVTEVTYKESRSVPGHLEVTIGDGADEEDSVVKAWNRMGQMASVLKTLTTDVGADLDLIIF